MDSGLPPIYQCPNEILEEVLGLVIRESAIGQHFKDASSLSLVCRHWRQVSLGAPNLWTSIHLRLDKSRAFKDAYWDELMVRVKAAPVRVSVIFTKFDTNHSMPSNFQNMVAVDSLMFQLSLGSQFELIMIPSFPIPKCVIGNFKILLPFLQDHYSWESITEWLINWPPIKHLEIKNLRDVGFKGNSPLRKTMELTLTSVRKASLSTIACAFPNLRSLTLHGEQPVDPHLVDDIAFPHLISICFGSASSNWQRKLCCPLIENVTHIWGNHLSLFEFLDAHQSVHTLDLSSSKLPLKLPEIAPQISTLTLKNDDNLELLHNWEKFSIIEPPFPELTKLIIDDEESTLTMDHFEQIVQRRCLPPENPDSQLDKQLSQRIRTLVIKIQESPYWRSSSLMKWAQQVSYNSGTEIELEWNNWNPHSKP